MPGEKSGELVALGMVLVTLTAKLLPRLVNTLETWLKGRETRRIKLKLNNGAVLELTGATIPDRLEELIQLMARNPNSRLAVHDAKPAHKDE